MPRKTPELTSLAASKQLLVLESDLNRRQLVEALGHWTVECHRTKEHVAQMVTAASTAVKLAGAFSLVRRIFSGRNGGGRKSWIAYLLDGMTAGTSLWQLLRSYRRKSEN
jgi:hypothetical protein